MLKFLTKHHKRNDACNIENARHSPQDLNSVHGRSYDFPQIYHVRIQSVNTILGVSTSYSGERLEADTTAGPFLTIPSRKAKAFMETWLRKRERARNKRRVTNELSALYQSAR